MTIRLAIIGAGIMGADHARIFAEDLPGSTLTVICDASEERARTVADNTDATDISTDPLACIARADVDAVLIASPDGTHAELTLAAIAASKPVLCEKPLAPGTADCQRIIHAETATGRRLVQVGFMRRFDPAYSEMKRKLDEGHLGRALMMHNFHRNVETPPSFTGAMAITNSAPHEFDAARFVLGGNFRSISAVQPKRTDTLVAPVVMILQTTDDQVVTIEVNNNAAYGYDVRGELVGELGSVTLGTPVWSRTHIGLSASETYDADWRSRFAEAYRLQNRAFLAFAQTGTPSKIASSAWDGLVSTLIAEKGVEALASGKTVPIEIPEPPALYRN